MFFFCRDEPPPLILRRRPLNGNPINKHKGFLSMRFPEHNVTVEYHRTPFLVVVARPPENSPEDVKMTVRVDEFNWQSKRWVGSDVLVFIQDIGGTKTKPLTCKNLI